jgi:hypothetical protein
VQSLQIDRRQLLRTGALAGGGLLLPGCATLASRPSPRGGCLPPVNVAPERVIRTMAGLRPYRAPGFVVRAESISDKRLVHNYGHGGAGITLSWGSSRLAAQLGLQGHEGPVAVVGAGVMGLSTARLVQEAGFPVTLYAKALPPETTSNVAGGQFHPYGHYEHDRVTPEWRAQFAAALDYSWRRFQIMVGDDYGIRWLPTYAERDTPERNCWRPSRRTAGCCGRTSIPSRSRRWRATTRSTSRSGAICASSSATWSLPAAGSRSASSRRPPRSPPCRSG